VKSIYDLIYLTPFVPLSLKGEGENIKKRGFAPLKLPFDIYWQPSPFIPLPCKGGGIGYIREASPPFNPPRF